MRLPRFATALTVVLTVVLVTTAACSSPAADVAPTTSAPVPASASTQPPSLLPLPEASLGAQGADRVQVELYLKSTAEVAEQVDATVAFRANGKVFTRATISQALQPGEAITVVVTPDFTGDVPMGYTSAIASLKVSDRIVVATAAPAPSNEPSTAAGEPSQEAVLPSEEASSQASAAPATPAGDLVESAGDFVCHAGIDNLPALTRGTGQKSDVLALQVILSQLGYAPGPFDGLFGKRTEAAVMSFQGDYGLSVDGQVGPKTWEAIVNAYC